MVVALTLSCCIDSILHAASIQTPAELSQAVKNPLLSTHIESLGNSSQYCVRLTVQNNGDCDFAVNVSPGVVLHHPEAQDILVTRPATMTIAAGQQSDLSLYGFCLQPTAPSPTEGQEFQVAKHNAQMHELAEKLAEGHYDPSQEQSIVWACSREFPAAGLQIERDQDRDFIRFIEELRGEQIPSYMADYGDLLDQPFEGVLREVRGVMIHAANRSFEKVSLNVFGPDNTLVYSLFSDEYIEEGTVYRFRFRMAGSAVSAGTYRLILRNADELIDTLEITI
jgi:hypothetical protein